MSYSKNLFISILVLFSVSVIFTDDGDISSEGPQWNHRAIYLNEDAELSFSEGEINDTLDLEIWSCPPVGVARCFLQKTVTVDPELTITPFSFDFGIKQILSYVTEEDINETIDSMAIENVEEQEIMKEELLERYNSDLFFEARILIEGQLLATSPTVRVVWSFGG